MKTDNKTLAGAMRILAQDIQTDDGAANSAIYEAACRIEELDRDYKEIQLERDQLQSMVFNLKRDLIGAKSTFEYYAKLHEQKGTEDGDQKALRNRLIAKELQRAIDATPEQSLAEIKAQAIEDACQTLDSHSSIKGGLIGKSDLFNYANQLRQSAEDRQ